MKRTVKGVEKGSLVVTGGVGRGVVGEGKEGEIRGSTVLFFSGAQMGFLYKHDESCSVLFGGCQ